MFFRKSSDLVNRSQLESTSSALIVLQSYYYNTLVFPHVKKKIKFSAFVLKIVSGGIEGRLEIAEVF